MALNFSLNHMSYFQEMFMYLNHKHFLADDSQSLSEGSWNLSSFPELFFFLFVLCVCVLENRCLSGGISHQKNAFSKNSNTENSFRDWWLYC